MTMHFPERLRWLACAALLQFSLAAYADPNVPGGPGCPMAHCDPQMSDNVDTSVPDPVYTRAAYYDANHPGSGYGLGCSSNLTTVACTYNGASGTLNNFEIFDGTGTPLYRSGTLNSSIDPGLDNAAAYSAPAVFADGSILAVDDKHLVYYFQQNGAWTAQFATLPADAGITINPVMITDHIVLLASYCGPQPTVPVYGQSPAACGVMTYSVSTSGLTLLDHAYLFDSRVHNQGGNGFFETLNTPTIDPQGPTLNAAGHTQPRVYILASELCVTCNKLGLNTRRQGRLWAVDVDPDTGLMSACYGGSTPNTCVSSSSFRVILNRDANGNLKNEAIDFPGPSGASPLLIKDGSGHARIFFDGTNRSLTLSSGTCPIPAAINMNGLLTAIIGCFYGVVDNGSAITALWSNKFPNAVFESSAALDSAGDFWAEPVVAGSYYTCSNTTNYSPPGTTPYRNCLIRFNPATGTVLSQIDLTLVADGHTKCTTGAPCYAPSSAFTIGNADDGFTITTGMAALNYSSKPVYVAKVTVPSTGPVSAVSWTIPAGVGTAHGQFPVVQYQSADGNVDRSVVLTTTHANNPASGSGPYFVGDP